MRSRAFTFLSWRVSSLTGDRRSQTEGDTESSKEDDQLSKSAGKGRDPG